MDTGMITMLEVVKAKWEEVSRQHKEVNPDCSCALCYKFPRLNIVLADSRVNGSIPLKDMAAAKRATSRQKGKRR
jgi:hypothetical protein